MPYDDHDYRMWINKNKKIVNIGQGPCFGDGDDWTWLADELKTLTVLVPDEMELRD